MKSQSIIIILITLLSSLQLSGVKADDDILINPGTGLELVDDNPQNNLAKRCECSCYKFLPPFNYELIATADTYKNTVAQDEECSSLEAAINTADLIFGSSLASRMCKGVLLSDMNEYLDAVEQGIVYDPRDIPHVDGGIFKCREEVIPPAPPVETTP